MIDEKHKNEIRTLKNRKIFFKVLPYFVFLSIFIISYFTGFEYNQNTNLFNDKLIDVSSIFFGVFIGCLYLFEKFKPNKTYSEFLKFCKILLYQNIVLIIYSFLIILINDKLKPTIFIKEYEFYPRILLFSFYIALFSVTLLNITRFIKIILKILSTSK